VSRVEARKETKFKRQEDGKKSEKQERKQRAGSRVKETNQ
jgi:hypothetical protein